MVWKIVVLSPKTTYGTEYVLFIRELRFLFNQLKITKYN